MDYCKFALTVIETEAKAVYQLMERIDIKFENACDRLLHCKGRVAVVGMGKSGHIASKIAATFSSTGTPAFFMHPGEANHGDLGMITPDDILVVISNSGNTHEIVTLLPLIKRLNVPLIALTGNKNSKLAQSASIHLDVSIEQEACPLGLAPTTSTTVALVMGDALAIALLQARGFSAIDFARFHPGGILGRRLLWCVDDVWHAGDELPIVYEKATISEAIIEVTAKKLGMTCVVDANGCLSGIYTDGDIRRTLMNHDNIKTIQMVDVMTRHCKTIRQGMLVSEALDLMKKHYITSLVVVNAESQPIAIVHMHDLLRTGIYS